MKKETLEFCLKELQKTYAKIFFKNALEKIIPALMVEPDRAIELACDYFILNSAYLPTPAQLLERVQHEGRQIRLAQGDRIEEERRQEKFREYMDGSILTRKFGGKLGDDWQMFMSHILAYPRTPWPELIDECWEMNRKYPGLNFDTLARDWMAEHTSVESEAV